MKNANEKNLKRYVLRKGSEVMVFDQARKFLFDDVWTTSTPQKAQSNIASRVAVLMEVPAKFVFVPKDQIVEMEMQ